ncbi:MAG TPA: 50S ribosomal protein L30 [Desulfosalsimonadaceae bacterium]|nr:50S ribosomal protein L30 [Desulfosalsimonadaceae bacterium]
MADTVKVTMIKSMNGRPEKQRRVLRSMGFGRMHQTVELPDNPATRGMIAKVTHMVKVEE